jgi:DNA-binding SARP family transcriptional activator/tetratricopeptide (TPR) repeat protein
MLHVSLLGEQAIADGRPGGMRVRSSRTVALVGFLAAHAGSPQTRQRIASAFWPDSTDAQALTNLRRELHNLRQVIGDCPCLTVTSRDLCWHDGEGCTVDLRVFAAERESALSASAAGDDQAAAAHAARAVAQYRGDFLPGLYDDWLLEVRSQLERQCVDLCELLVTVLTRTGDLAGAAAAARRWTQLEPLAEPAYRALMLLQADLGDRAGAVSTYHHCASVLERELGVVPDPATQRVFQCLLSAEAAPAGRADSRGGPAQPELVGRSAELGLLAGRWRAAVAGQPGVVVVCGGAGVGKSRLVSELAETAELAGAVVASCRCFGASGGLALAPVAEWLRAPAVGSAVAGLDPLWQREVGRLVPSSAHADAGSHPFADAWQRHRFIEGLARAVLAVGRATLLVLDNIQWSDHETLDFLILLLRMSSDANAPLLVAATLRDDEPRDPAHAEWASRLRDAGLLTEIALSPLETADTAKIAEAILGRAVSPGDAELLQAATGGFPLYTIEAVRGTAHQQAGLRPVGNLQAVLASRLAQASPAARELAGLAAAVGTDFGLDLLTEASDLAADAVVAGLDELWQRRIVREFGDGYVFSHDLLRDAAYAQVSPPRRWLLHRRVAQGLELLHAGDTDTVAGQLAAQYARGGRPERALQYYRRAADVAAGLFAYAAAVRLHQESLSLIRTRPPGHDRDIRELAVLEAMAPPLSASSGQSSPDLQAGLERAVELSRSLGKPKSMLLGMLGLWASSFVQGRIADSLQRATDALALAAPESHESGAAHFGVAGSSLSLGMPAAALPHFEVAGRLLDDSPLIVGTGPRFHAAAWAAHAQWLVGDDAAARASTDGALAAARLSDPYNLAVTVAYAAVTSQMSGDRAQVSDAAAELAELCDRYDFSYYRQWALILGAWARADAKGVRQARNAVNSLKAAGSLTRMPYWLSVLADLQERAGQPAAAQATLDAAVAVSRARDDVWWLPEVLRMRARYDPAEAAAARLRQAARLAEQHGSLALARRCDADLAGLEATSVRTGA